MRLIVNYVLHCPRRSLNPQAIRRSCLPALLFRDVCSSYSSLAIFFFYRCTSPPDIQSRAFDHLCFTDFIKYPHSDRCLSTNWSCSITFYSTDFMGKNRRRRHQADDCPSLFLHSNYLEYGFGFFTFLYLDICHTFGDRTGQVTLFC